jgi:hypothetical protein
MRAELHTCHAANAFGEIYYWIPVSSHFCLSFRVFSISSLT